MQKRAQRVQPDSMETPAPTHVLVTVNAPETPVQHVKTGFTTIPTVIVMIRVTVRVKLALVQTNVIPVQMVNMVISVNIRA